MTDLTLEDPFQDRLGDAFNAEKISKQFADHYNNTKAQSHAHLAGCLDGNPPFDQDELDKNGLSWFSNVNFRGLESDVAFSSIPLYELFQEVFPYVTVSIEGLKDDKDGVHRAENILALNHAQLMKDWGDFNLTMQLIIRMRRTYGMGSAYFKDEDDFRFYHAQHDCVRFASNTKVFFSGMEILEIVDSMSLPDLNRVLDNPASKEAGWNVEFIRELVTKRCNQFKKCTKTITEWQRDIRHNSAAYEVLVPKLDIANFFVREYDDTITHAIVADKGNYGKYLFYRRGRYKDFRQIYHPINDEIGDGYLDGVKGLALKCYNFRDGQNRLKNHNYNAAIAGSQVLLQPTEAASQEPLNIEQHGTYVVLPFGYEYKQNPIGSVIDKSVAVDSMLERDLMRNIGGIRQNLSNDGSNPISATESTIVAGQTNSVTKAEKDLFLQQLDALYQEQFNRILKPITDEKPAGWKKLVKDFQDKCKKDGVPSSVFSENEKLRVIVEAKRSVGKGSEFFKNQVGREILQLFPILPDSVKVRHIRNHIANLAGSHYLSEIWPEAEIPNLPTDHESKAQDENAGLLVGVMPIWTPTQNNLAHATVHLAFLGQKLQEIQGGFPVESFLQMFQLAAPHVEQTIQSLFSDKSIGKKAQELWNAYQQITNQVKKLASDYQESANARQAEAQRLQEAQNSIPTEQQIKLAKIQADKETNLVKIKADAEVKAAKVQGDLAIKASVASQDTAIKRENAVKRVPKK